MKKLVSDVVVEVLQQWGVKRVYGIPNDTIDPLMESLRNQSQIQFILVRHEETAAFAASMEARLNGKIAVCIASQGPGAIHLLSGMYDAAMDGIPVLAITGQVDTSLLFTRMVQEVNQNVLFNDVCCFNGVVINPEQTIQVLSRAFRSAIMKRGPVHLAIPSDILRALAPNSAFELAPPISNGVKEPEAESLKLAIELIKSAKRPCILYGIGAAKAMDEVKALANVIQAPLVYTSRSKDCLESSHPSLMGGVGLLGSRAANHAVHHCDLLIVLGSSFAFTEYYPHDAKILQIDNQLENLGLHAPISMGMAADCKAALQKILKELSQQGDKMFLKECCEHKKFDLTVYDIQNRISISKHRIHPVTLFDSINKFAPENTIFTIDVGVGIIWGNNLLNMNGKQRFIWSANLGSLGCALPNGIAAKLAMPDCCSVVISSDDSFDTFISEIMTAVKYNAPVVCIVLNSAAFRRIDKTESENDAFIATDFAASGKARGADGATVRVLDDLDAALQKAFASKRPYVLDVYLEPDAKPIPPLINPRMALALTKSRFKGLFSKLSGADNAGPRTEGE